MILILIVAVLFLAGALYNFVAPDGDPVEGAGGLSIVTVLLATYASLHRNNRKTAKK